MAKVIDEHGNEYPTQEAYFAAMAKKNPFIAAVTQIATDIHEAQKPEPAPPSAL